MRLRSCLTLFVALSVFGCVTGPKVTVWVVDPAGFVNGSGTGLPYADPKSGELGLACTSADDFYRIVKACRSGGGAPDTIVCSWDFTFQDFACSDGQLVSPEEIVNWSCLSARDWNRYLTYCRRKVRGIESPATQ
jgi:hypothetical protein